MSRSSSHVTFFGSALVLALASCGIRSSDSIPSENSNGAFSISAPKSAFEEHYEIDPQNNGSLGNFPVEKGLVKARVFEEFEQVRSWYRSKIRLPIEDGAALDLVLTRAPIALSTRTTDLDFEVDIGVLGCTSAGKDCKVQRNIKQLDARMKFYFDMPGVARDVVYPEMGDITFSAVHDMKLDTGIKIKLDFLKGIGNEFVKKFLTFLNVNNQLDLGMALKYQVNVQGLASHELDYKRTLMGAPTLSAFQQKILNQVLIPACKELALNKGRDVTFCDKPVAATDFDTRMQCVLTGRGPDCTNVVEPTPDTTHPTPAPVLPAAEFSEMRCQGPSFLNPSSIIYFRRTATFPKEGATLYLLAKDQAGKLYWPIRKPEVTYWKNRAYIASPLANMCREISGEGECAYLYANGDTCNAGGDYVLSEAMDPARLNR